jgi:hypothetical protein
VAAGDATKSVVRRFVTVWLASFVGCTDTSGLSSGGAGADAGVDAAPPCDASLSDDRANCGACGRACGLDEYCR